jgi:hypothetical protein
MTVLNTPEAISFPHLAALRGAPRLELRGLRRSRGPTAYAILKRDYHYKGTKAQVLEAVNRDIEEILGKVPGRGVPDVRGDPS